MSDSTATAASPICDRCGAPLPGGAGGAATSCPHCGAPLPGAAEALGLRADRRRALRVFTLFGRSAALTFAVPGLLAAGLAFGMLTTAEDLVPAAVRFGFPLFMAGIACTPLVLTFVFHAGLRSMIEPEEPDPPE
ncbi:hypothetical protein [Alienimonas californiensis]|uniref:Zinc ribbon domain-containing protein n=1 Tax=Alienimonas californiensis TaxID=2527989 RepID=A0A517P3P1_9PLAN|nr:hypothetical protein [Alienimonas californiensis]QDT13990.1 hypothetical protein CA12_00580 [Alienimonas californiensis]